MKCMLLLPLLVVAGCGGAAAATQEPSGPTTEFAPQNPYSIDLPDDGALVAGAPLPMVFTLRLGEGDEFTFGYPIWLTLEGPGCGENDTLELRRRDAISASGAELQFAPSCTPLASGPAEYRATIHFSECFSNRCVTDTQEFSWTVRVRE